MFGQWAITIVITPEPNWEMGTICNSSTRKKRIGRRYLLVPQFLPGRRMPTIIALVALFTVTWTCIFQSSLLSRVISRNLTSLLYSNSSPKKGYLLWFRVPLLKKYIKIQCWTPFRHFCVNTVYEIAQRSYTPTKMHDHQTIGIADAHNSHVS